MKRAFMHTGQYDGMIAMTMTHVDVAGGAMSRRATTRPTSTPHGGPRPLRYGENPHQTASWIQFPPDFDRAWKVHQGKELSYTNLLDLDAALRIALEFSEPAAVVIKHTNPCGVATGTTIDAAYVRARDADSLSAFGGIVGLNQHVDVATARALTSTFIEAVIAPSLEGEALAVLAAKQNMRVVTTDFSKALEPLGDGERPGVAVVSWRRAATADRQGDRGGGTLAGGRFSKGRHETPADRRGMDRVAICVARMRTCEVQCGDLYRRGSDARDWCRTDESRGRGQGGGHEGRWISCTAACRPRMRFFRFATVSTRLRPQARPPSCSPAARFATPK